MRRTFVIAGWFAALGLLVAVVMDFWFAVGAGSRWHLQDWDLVHWVLWIYPASFSFMAADSALARPFFRWVIITQVAVYNAGVYGVVGLVVGLIWRRFHPEAAAGKS